VKNSKKGTSRLQKGNIPTKRGQFSLEGKKTLRNAKSSRQLQEEVHLFISLRARIALAGGKKSRERGISKLDPGQKTLKKALYPSAKTPPEGLGNQTPTHIETKTFAIREKKVPLFFPPERKRKVLSALDAK